MTKKMMKPQTRYEGTKVVSLRELKVLNDESIKKGLNKNLYFTKYTQDLKKIMLSDSSKLGHWRGMNTELFLSPLMYHGDFINHQMRALVRTGNVLPDVILDIPFSSWKNLTELNDVLKEVA